MVLVPFHLFVVRPDRDRQESRIFFETGRFVRTFVRPPPDIRLFGGTNSVCKTVRILGAVEERVRHLCEFLEAYASFAPRPAALPIEPVPRTQTVGGCGHRTRKLRHRPLPSACKQLISGLFHLFGHGFPIALFFIKMEMGMVPPDGGADSELSGGALSVAELLEVDKEFLEALTMRLDEISGRPKGRFVISYLPGQPGARQPPTIR
jgi:hypothetical protein